MKKLLILLALLFSTPALAQPVQCPDQPNGNSSNACANTRFVITNGGGGGTAALTNNHIFVGNAFNVATDVAMTGDCSIIFAGGAITCTKSSGSTILGMAFQAPSAVSITGGTITGLPTPTVSADAATKGYVDSAVSTGRTPLAPVRLATTAVLSNTPTYANGAAGVGATLTAGSNGVLSVDSTAVNSADRVLVKDQASQLQNGCYTLTTVGTVSVPYVLTRCTDSDTAAELPNGLTTLITAGTVNSNSSWTLNQPSAITVGTTALPWIQTGVPATSYWTLAGNDITNNNSGLVKTAGGFEIQTTNSIWGVNASGAAGSFFGFNSYIDNSGTYKALTTGNRAGYIQFDNSGMALQVSSGTQTATSALSTMLPVFNVDTSANVGIGNTTPGSKLDVTKALAAGNDNYMLTIRNPTTSVDARAGLRFQINALTNSFGPTISASNDGVTAAGNLIFGNFINSVWSESMRLAYQGTLGIGTVTPDLTTKLNVIQGTGGSPVTSIAHSVQITRTEQLASPLDTEGGQNAALDVVANGNNTSVPGTNIAQPVAGAFTATQSGSGDSVGLFSTGINNGTGTYVAFGAFISAYANSGTTGAVAIGLNTSNSSGVARPYVPSGAVYFIGVDSPCAGSNGCSASFLARATGNVWDVGVGLQNGSVSRIGFSDDSNSTTTLAATGAHTNGIDLRNASFSSAAYRSTNFSVDNAGNETALSNTAISDERLKVLHGPFTRGLADISKINPILYDWIQYPDRPVSAGVSAQNVQQAIPEAVSVVDSDGHLGVSDRPLVAALINAVKELDACRASWRCRIFGWRP